jgi:hypothetical protein
MLFANAMERDVIRELDGDFRRDDRRQSQDMARWPVLAKLPRVSADPALGAVQLPTSAANETVRSDSAFEFTIQSPEVIEHPTRYVVDAPHAAHAGGGKLSSAELSNRESGARPAAERLDRASAGAAATTHSAPRFRFDQPSGHRPPGRSLPAPAESMTFAGRIFRLHALFAPHMGLVGAAALVACGGLLYWAAIGRSGPAIEPSKLLEFGAGWSQESPPQSPAPGKQNLPQAVSEGLPPSVEWAAPPRVADAAAAGAATGSAAPLGAPAGTADGPALAPPNSAPASALEQPMGDLPTTTSIQNLITPTAETACYPVTPFPAYAFDKLAQVPAASPGAIVAERTPNSSTATSSPQ